MEKFFKDQLRWLKDQGHYDPSSDTDRYVMVGVLYIYIMLLLCHRSGLQFLSFVKFLIETLKKVT